MGRIVLTALLCTARVVAQAVSTPATQTPPALAERPLPQVRDLVLDVERNQQAAEAARRDYTYHIHEEDQELDGKGNIKKTTTTDSESVTIRGVRVDRVTARDGRPLNADEQRKENEKIDKEVEKDTERREKLADKGKETDSRGDELIPASRILQLLVFTNPRRVEFNGRPAIAADFTGDPNAKTRNPGESIIRDLTGTVWFDEQDRVIAHAEGRFLNDFKIGGGLVADVKKNSSFEATFSKVNDEVWLPKDIEGQGRLRFLLVAGFSGRMRLTVSDYRKFRSSSSIVSIGGEVGPDGKHVPDDAPKTPPAPAPKP
jgi:hypothetical protein